MHNEIYEQKSEDKRSNQSIYLIFISNIIYLI